MCKGLGKIERFWRTLNEDLLCDYQFESVDELKEELLHYVNYYNNERSHQGLKGNTPSNCNENVQRIT